MMTMRILAIFLLLSLIISCSADDPLLSNKNSVTHSTCTFSESDNFQLIAANIEEGVLIIEVQYAGGCLEHEFCLIWPDVITAIYPPDFSVILNHNANNDGCEALITETIVFDPMDSGLDLSNEAIAAMKITIINGSNPSETISNK